MMKQGPLRIVTGPETEKDREIARQNGECTEQEEETVCPRGWKKPRGAVSLLKKN